VNLLSDPVFRVRKVNGEASFVSLPEAFEALSVDLIDNFTGVRPHQSHALHAFFSQLGAMATNAAGKTLKTADEWRAAILLLSPSDLGNSPWDVIGNFDKPAFMQIPAPDAGLWRKRETSPDDIDVLISTKNHEMKQGVIDPTEIEQWVFALISAQTSIGFTGPKCYGIFRMNGGLGSRSCYGIKPKGGIGSHIMRDINVLLDSRATIVKDYDFAEQGLALLWIEPWDGKAQVASRNLDPYFIEIARRLRLIRLDDGTISCLRETSDNTRVVPAIRGMTGDPWTPIVTRDKDGAKSLTIAENPFGYERIVRQLFGSEGLDLPVAMEVRPDDGDDLQIILRGLVRGQGKTAGYHERLIPISRKTGIGIRQRFTDPVAKIATERVQDAGEVSKKLEFAILSLQQNGGDKITRDRKNSAAYASGCGDEFSDAVDLSFFEDLDLEAKEDTSEAASLIRNDWQRKVIRIARQILDREIKRSPASSVSKYRAAARARGIFEGGVRKAFEHLYEKEVVNESA